MKLDLSKPYDKAKAETRFKVLLDKGAKIELTEIRPKRTLNQNAYLHVCIALIALELGYTLDQMKSVLKKECEFMQYEKNGYVFFRHTRDMDTKELGEFIDWIINFAGVQGIIIPSSEDYIKYRFEIDKEIELNKMHL